MPQASLINKATALSVLSHVNLLAESGQFAIDIGGSLVKLLYVQRNGDTERAIIIKKLDQNWPGAQLSVPIPEIGVKLHFFAFETRNIDELVKFFRVQWGLLQSPGSPSTVRATGGGAVKYAKLFADELGVHLQHLEEMYCLVRGLNFLLTKVQKEVYMFDHEPLLSATMSAPASPQVFPEAMNCRKFVSAYENPFPYLLVNIGSGVSIIKVTGLDEYERVSGSSLGGGTFWGLSRLLTHCKTFDEVIELTMSGDNSKVDMLVGDIYGGDYNKLGLDASVIAASFGRVTMKKEGDVTSFHEMWKQFVRAVKGCSYLWLNFVLSTPGLGTFLRWMELDKWAHEQLANLGLRSAFKPNDVALSLLRMVAFNIGQIAFLNSKRYDIRRIYFGGNFIRDHPYTLAAISFAVRFWSNGESQALFLQHDGFLGVIGAYLGNDDFRSSSSGESETTDAEAEAEVESEAEARTETHTNGEPRGEPTTPPAEPSKKSPPEPLASTPPPEEEVERSRPPNGVAHGSEGAVPAAAAAQVTDSLGISKAVTRSVPPAAPSPSDPSAGEEGTRTQDRKEDETWVVVSSRRRRRQQRAGSRESSAPTPSEP